MVCFRWPFSLPASFSRRVRFAPLKNLATPSFPCGIFVLGVGCALLITTSAESVSNKVLAILALAAPRNCSCTRTQACVREFSRATTKHDTTLISRHCACGGQHHPCSAETPPEGCLVSLIIFLSRHICCGHAARSSRRQHQHKHASAQACFLRADASLDLAAGGPTAGAAGEPDFLGPSVNLLERSARACGSAHAQENLQTRAPPAELPGRLYMVEPESCPRVRRAFSVEGARRAATPPLRAREALRRRGAR